MPQLAHEILSSYLHRKIVYLPKAMPSDQALPLEWEELDAFLPDGGLPKGVTEVAAPYGMGGSTSFALAALRAAQGVHERAWCAWLDTDSTLYAPGVCKSGVDLERLLVVRPGREEMGRIAVKLVQARVFEIVVVDVDSFLEAKSSSQSDGLRRGSRQKDRRGMPRRPQRKSVAAGIKGAPAVWVRKLSLAAEASGTRVLLLTDRFRTRSTPLPVSLRIELERLSPDRMGVRIGKDKRGRHGQVTALQW